VTITTVPTAPARKHLDYLDGLRALAAIYVVLHHISLYFLVDSTAEIPPLLNFILRILAMGGHYAVAVFIVLSGFCLMLPVTRRGELQGGAVLFFKKRARRILPPYYCALALSILVVLTLVQNRPHPQDYWMSNIVTAKDILSHIFLVHDLFESTSSSINYVFWSIAVEWRIYFLFPLFVILWKKYGPYPTTIGVMILSYLAQIGLSHTPLNSTAWGMCLHFTGLFAMGMLACEIAFSEQKLYGFRDKISWRLLAWISLPAAFFLAYKARAFYYSDFFAAAWAFCSLIHLSRQTTGILRIWLNWKPMVFFGTFAFSIYLIHPLVLQLVMQYIILPLNVSTPVKITFSLVLAPFVCILLSYCFFLLCEKPFANFRKAKSF
jgi:peptidoglycan/LPS O-acetylase OafA/YrhL